MKHPSLVVAAVVLTILSSCGSHPEIENWDPKLFESWGAPFLKQPTHFVKFSGPYEHGGSNCLYFSFETQNHAQSRKYVEQCVKAIEKYADKVYIVPTYAYSLTLEELRKYEVRKGRIRILEDPQQLGWYGCTVIYSKDGDYFKFSGGYYTTSPGAKSATCRIGIYPMPHFSAL